MIEPPRVSFVIPCYRAEATLVSTLEAIYTQQDPVPFEVIRVESGRQGSSSPEPFRQEKIIWQAERMGPAAARNRGAAASESPYLAFVDSDAILKPDWLASLLRAIEEVETDLVGGAISNRNPEEVPSRILHLIEFSEFLPGGRDSFRESISTSNCLIRRERFLELGGFDEEWMMAEDLEFCRRLSTRPFFVGRTGMAHQHRSDWPAVESHLRHLGYWSGRLRRELRGVSGWWLRYFPFLTGALLPLRYYRIKGRWGKSDLPAEYDFGRDQRALLRGLRHWTAGFRQGVGGRPVPG